MDGARADERSSLIAGERRSASDGFRRRASSTACASAIVATMLAMAGGHAWIRSRLGTNSRAVTFTVEAGCPPESFKQAHPEFFENSIVSVKLLTKCPPQDGGDWTFTTMNRVPATKQYTVTATVADECEYGFSLVNSLGDEIFEVGGSNVDTPMRNAECIEPVPAGGNLYWNRRMSQHMGSTSIKWAWGHCQEECPILCKIIALSNATENNVYSVLERDKDEIWHRAEGTFKSIHAGYNDLWAVKNDNTVYKSTIDNLNISSSNWQSVPSGTLPGSLQSIDVGLEEAYFVRTDNKYYAKPADNSGAWRVMPGGLKQVAVGKQYLYGLTHSPTNPSTSGWVWACVLPCSGTGIHTDFPEGRTARQCEVSLDYVYCTSETNKVYRMDARLSFFRNGHDASGGLWGWPVTRPVSSWTLIPNIQAKMVTVGDFNVWAIDTEGTVKFCPQPCNDGQWVTPTGVPRGIVYIDASKYN